MSNFDHEIRQDVAEAIKGKPLYADYAGWNFFGKVWWADDQWHCEVWQYRSPSGVISAKTLEELMSEVSNEYGHD